jgi:hypothetical protein
MLVINPLFTSLYGYLTMLSHTKMDRASLPNTKMKNIFPLPLLSTATFLQTQDKCALLGKIGHLYPAKC